MAKRRIHFGPLQVFEYEDGYVRAFDFACNGLGFDTESDNWDISETSYDLAKVTCAYCKRAVTQKGLTRPDIKREQGTARGVAFPYGGYDIEKNNQIRTALGLNPVLPEPEAKFLYIEQVKRRIATLKDVILNEQKRMERMEEARDSTISLLVPSETPWVAGEKKAARTTRHFWPATATMYVDGYTRASGTACGLISDEYDTESSEWNPDLFEANPLNVTCKKCKTTKLFREAFDKTSAGGTPVVEVNAVPRMRAALLKNPGLFNVDKNNRVRDLLGLEPVFPNGTRRGLVSAEIRTKIGYARNRIDNATSDLKAAQLLLMKLEYEVSGPGPQNSVFAPTEQSTLGADEAAQPPNEVRFPRGKDQ